MSGSLARVCVSREAIVIPARGPLALRPEVVPRTHAAAHRAERGHSIRSGGALPALSSPETSRPPALFLPLAGRRLAVPHGSQGCRLTRLRDKRIVESYSDHAGHSAPGQGRNGAPLLPLPTCQPLPA